MCLLKLHFSISVLCLITFIGFREVFKQSVKDNGWIDGETRKKLSGYSIFFVPILNVLVVILELMMISVKKKDFDKMCEEAKKNSEVSYHE